MFIDKVGFLLDLVPPLGRRLARLSTQFVESGNISGAASGKPMSSYVCPLEERRFFLILPVPEPGWRDEDMVDVRSTLL